MAWTLEPDDPQAIPPQRYVSVYMYPDDPTGDCQPDPHDTVMAGDPCTVEQPGLTYRLGVAQHEYFYRKGTTLLNVVGSIAVDRAVLRDAILKARPSDKPELYATDIPGYEGSEQGIPPGMLFSPTDMTQAPNAKFVEVDAHPGSRAGDCAAFQNSGTPSP